MEQCFSVFRKGTVRSKFITKGLHLPLHLVKPTSRWFVFIQIIFPQKPECLAEWGAKHLFAFGFQCGKYAAIQFCQAERRTNSGNAAAFGEKCADLSRRGVQLLPAGQSIPLCRNVCTFICRSSIEELKAKFGDHVHVLDWALHLDESTPHIHERHVFDCENKYGEVAPQQEKALEALGFDLPDPDKPLSRRNNRKITFDTACRKMLFEIAKRHGLELEEEAEYGNRKYLEKQDFILVKQKEQLAAQQNKLDKLTLKVNDMEALIDEVSAAAYDKAVEVVTDVVRTETRKEDMRMIEDTKKWVLSPERKAPQSTREYAAHRLDTVLDKFLKTMQTTATRLQEKLLKPEARQKGKEQVKEKARDSVLQLLNRLQAEQAQNKPAAQLRTQEGHSEI